MKGLFGDAAGRKPLARFLLRAVAKKQMLWETVLIEVEGAGKGRRSVRLSVMPLGGNHGSYLGCNLPA